MSSPIRLTEMVACAGCAAKLGPAQLTTAVKGLYDGIPLNDNVLVGFDLLDDAGVYRIDENRALVQTTDFITPLVDDPFIYGQIAAANAISDVYAMGGTPITALNIVCFPSTADPGILREILRGGLDMTGQAGVALLGGHSVDDPEIKYGLAVTGLIDPAHILTNSRARPGDRLVLTKALGTGAITTGIKQVKASKASIDAAIQSMTTLNNSASLAALEAHANAATDVTGFSLIGHLSHMVRASGLAAQIDTSALPILPGALDLIREGVFPGGTDRNRAHFGQFAEVSDHVDSALANIVFDPQTSGGLLISLPADAVADLLVALHGWGLPAAIIGEMLAAGQPRIIVS